MIKRSTVFFFSIIAAFLLSPPWSALAEDAPDPALQQIDLPAQLTPQLSVDRTTLRNGVSIKAVIADPNPAAPRRKIPAPAALAAAPAEASASFNITYINAGGTDLWGELCYAFPTEAMAAFNAAADIWANTISSAVPITISACWADLGSSSILGYSGGGGLHSNFSGAPRPNTWYAASLANALSGSDLDEFGDDMHITYNRNFAWYYGTDGNTTTSQYDLMSVALHEIAHGLNFSGSMRYAGNSGSWGYGTGYPNIYDVFMYDGSGTQLTDTGVYPNPSTALGSALVSDDIWFHGGSAMAANGGQPVKIYAPGTWSGGSSYSHLDYAAFNNTTNQLMVYAISNGESIHDPGAVTGGLLQDLGWTMPGSPPPPPSWVIASDGTYTDRIELTWESVPGATGYTVYSSQSTEGLKTSIGSTATPAMSVTDATPDVLYYFWISASNAWGEGSLSSSESGYAASAPVVTYTLIVTKSGSGTGTVTSSPTGISCGSDCSEVYDENQEVTLTAVPAAGSSFAGWSGDCDAGGRVLLDSDKACTAAFILNTYTVTANAAGNGTGSVTSNIGGIYYTYPETSTSTTSVLPHGSSITLTASSGTGSAVSWSGCASTGGTSTIATCSFPGLYADMTVTAVFTLNAYTVTPNQAANGSILPATPQTVDHGSTTSFSIIPDPDYRIDHVAGCGGSLVGDLYTTGPVIADCSVSASFAANSYELAVNIAGPGSVTSEPSGIACTSDCAELFAAGTLVTLTAVPLENSTFTGWSGDCAGTDLTCVVVLNQAGSVSAAFNAPFPWPMFLPAITK